MKEWSRIKERNEVEKLLSKRNEERKNEETTGAGKSKKSGLFFRCNKQSNIHKKNDETGDELTPLPSPSITLTKASSRSTDVSVTEHFLETLQVGLDEFIESVKNEKVVINSLEVLVKNYLSFHQKLIFFKENSARKKATNFQTDLNQLNKMLAMLSQLIISCNNVKIDPVLGLLPLQKNVLQKSKLCNEMSVNTFILDKSIKTNLNQRVTELKKCDISFERLSKVAFFCCNKFKLTWAKGLDNLEVMLESNNFNLKMASVDVNHLANLLELFNCWC